MERNTERLKLATIVLKRLQTPLKSKLYTQQEKVSRFYYFPPYFELFCTMVNDRYIPIQILIITLLRHVMLTGSLVYLCPNTGRCDEAFFFFPSAVFSGKLIVQLRHKNNVLNLKHNFYCPFFPMSRNIKHFSYFPNKQKVTSMAMV